MIAQNPQQAAAPSLQHLYGLIGSHHRNNSLKREHSQANLLMADLSQNQQLHKLATNKLGNKLPYKIFCAVRCAVALSRELGENGQALKSFISDISLSLRPVLGDMIDDGQPASLNPKNGIKL